ncbi:MAG: TIGR01777 family oxidoreductase [Acidobacteria bacterium]|nr:TIGR01777 family oxidoreductase [Acidobacteriota bacterium]
MTIVLAGGSGFLGRALHRHFSASGHLVRTLTRSPRPGVDTDVHWQPNGDSGSWAAALTDADIVVNLAGQGIGDKRWTEARKQALRTSRLLPTRSLARALAGAPVRRRTFITSSAVGYYGPHGDESVTEQTLPGDDFLSLLCVDWEAEAQAAASATTSVAQVRTGLVLHPRGGALEAMLPPFRLGLGGPMGSGRQFMSWIHLDDWLALMAWIARRGQNAGVGGAWNATAPRPVTNAEFTRTLGRVLHRPAVLPVPGVALRLLLGEVAQLLLTGARVLPEVAERGGFHFTFVELEHALEDLLGR